MEQVWEDGTQRNDYYLMSPRWLLTNLTTDYGWEQPFNHAAILWLLYSEVTGGKRKVLPYTTRMMRLSGCLIFKQYYTQSDLN